VEWHGGQIPVVAPRGHKAHHLKPERYLFQWAGHVISPRTVNRLMWLVLNNIELRDATGEPFDVTSHLLRHVGITVARHDFGVPLEVAAEMLHHTRNTDGTAPPATLYYSKLPAGDAAFVWHQQIQQSCAGIGRAGGYSGAGSPAPEVAGHISAPKCGT